MHLKNRDDLLHLSFTWKISLFSEAYIQPSRTYMMEIYCKNSKLLSIFTKKLDTS